MRKHREAGYWVCQHSGCYATLVPIVSVKTRPRRKGIVFETKNKNKPIWWENNAEGQAGTYLELDDARSKKKVWPLMFEHKVCESKWTVLKNVLRHCWHFSAFPSDSAPWALCPPRHDPDVKADVCDKKINNLKSSNFIRLIATFDVVFISNFLMEHCCI